jgi:hypothetical protein
MNGSRAAVVLTFAAVMTMGVAPWRSLPECVIGRWSGITPVDAQGTPTGPPDPADWGCLNATGTAGGAAHALDDPVPAPPPPTDFCLYPAAPNPALGATRVRLAVPQAGHVRVDIYAKKGQGPHNARVVRTLIDATLVSGLHELLWDGKDSSGVRLPADLYRLVMQTETGTVCGDIELR